jgi:pimeloyl-ACP methyl ester carboxylesterase
MYSVSGVDQLLMFRTNSDASSFYSVDLRPIGWTDSNDIRVGKTSDGSLEWNYILYPSDIGCNIINNEWYELLINVSGANIDVSIKCSEDSDFRSIFSIVDNNPLQGKDVGFGAWSGDWNGLTEKLFDDFRLTYGNADRNSLILIPGFGASWSTEGLFYDDDNSNWIMSPMVDNYNNFSQSALQLGWEEGVDYYVWNYDWRKPLDEIAVDLDEYLEENIEEEKIDIVGHSLGGLVARAWKQNYDDKNQSDKIITVGSPHKGVVQAYEALAGGKLPDNPFVQNVAMRLLINILGVGYPTDADFLRDQLPILKDISPTFDFVKKGGQIKNVSENYFYNDYLFGLNEDLGDVDIFTYLSGNTGVSTPRWLILGQRRIVDTILGLWPDGSEIKMEKDLGDGTVSLISSFLGQDCLHQLELSHGDMISDENGLEEVFSLLLDEDIDLSFATPEENKVFFYLASPATLMVNDVEPDNSQEQFIVLPHEDGKEYDIKLTGISDGEFHFSFGKILNDKYELSTIKGRISEGEVKNYNLDSELNVSTSDMLTIVGDNLRDINNDSNIKSAIKEIEQAEKLIGKNRKLLAISKIKNAMRKISNYRNKLKSEQIEEYNIALDQMDSLAEILNRIESRSLFDFLRKNLADAKIKVAERKIELNNKKNRDVFMDALSLNQALDIISNQKLLTGDIFEADLLLNEAVR